MPANAVIHPNVIIDPQAMRQLARRVLLVVCCGWLLLQQADAADTRGYVISLIHTATHADPANCPQGGNGGVVDLKMRVLMDLGHSREQAAAIIANNGRDAQGNYVDVRKRGTIDGQTVDVQAFPLSVPDPQIRVVQGSQAYGFNLDGKVKDDDFIDPASGQRGIDNQLWRVLGCFEMYDVRRPVIPYSEGIAWDTALDSMPAWLMWISGDDLDRDGEVTVTFERSLNTAMRDASSSVLAASSYTVDPDPRSHSTFKGRIEKGVLSIEPGEFYMQGESQFYAVLRFTHTQLRLQLREDGSLSGLIGGYQPWLDYFHYLAIRGEETGQVDIPGVYYAMQRLADADPDASGRNRAISAAYYIEAVPAFLTSVERKTLARAHLPEAPRPVASLQQDAAVRNR